jgi:hypothetical protein
LAIIAILGIIIGLVACDNDNGKDDPKDQSEIITGLFDNNSSATVQGYFTDTDWAGVAGKIKTALNTRFEMAGTGAKSMFKDVFARGVTIIVEKNPQGYTNWKTTGDGKTMYLNFNLDNIALLESGQTALMEAISYAVGNLNNNEEDYF